MPRGKKVCKKQDEEDLDSLTVFIKSIGSVSTTIRRKKKEVSHLIKDTGCHSEHTSILSAALSGLVRLKRDLKVLVDRLQELVAPDAPYLAKCGQDLKDLEVFTSNVEELLNIAKPMSRPESVPSTYASRKYVASMRLAAKLALASEKRRLEREKQECDTTINQLQRELEAAKSKLSSIGKRANRSSDLYDSLHEAMQPEEIDVVYEPLEVADKAPLLPLELAENVIPLEVVNETKRHKQLKRLAALPCNLTVKTVFPDNVKSVTEFSKKTGDFPSLSSVDLKVMTLNCQLEKEFVGIDNLADESFDNVCGLYNEDKIKDNLHDKSVVDDADLIVKYMKELEFCDEAEEGLKGKGEKDHSKNEDVLLENDKEPENNDIISSDSLLKPKEKGEKPLMVEKSLQHQEEAQSSKQNHSKLDNGLKKDDIMFEVTTPDYDYKDDLTPSPPDDQIELGYSSDDMRDSTFSDDNIFDDDDKNVKFKPPEDMTVLKRIEQNSQECDDISDDDSIYNDDDCGWITPSNISEAKRESAAGVLPDEPVTFAWLTTDFAMQNILLQMGLNVMAEDGRIVKQVRTYIQRCQPAAKQHPS